MVACAAATAALAACKSDSPNEPTPTQTIAIRSGSDAQTGMAGMMLAAPIAVRVTQGGVAVAGAPVTWTIQTGGGTLSAVSSTTNSSGEAEVNWTLGPTEGANTVLASIGNGQYVTFTATATTNTFSSLALVSGNAQTVASGAVTAPFVVRATDASGNPLAGVTVSWTVTGTATLSSASTMTGSDGTASVTATPTGANGTFVITATAGAAAPVTFNLTTSP